MYTDDTPIPFGKYKFMSLCRVPAEYLLNIYNSKDKTHKELYEYIESNIEKIILRKEGMILPPPFEFPCDKITYANEKMAKEILSKIRNIEQDHKKPVRVYECPDCGGWHLTSIPIWQPIASQTAS